MPRLSRCPICGSILTKLKEEYACPVCNIKFSDRLPRIEVFGIGKERVAEGDALVTDLGRCFIVRPLRGGKQVAPSTYRYFVTLLRKLYSMPVSWVCAEVRERLETLPPGFRPVRPPTQVRVGLKLRGAYEFNSRKAYVLVGTRATRVCISQSESGYFGYRRFYALLLALFSCRER